MRALLVVAAALVFLAGMQLFIFATRTATYFAWNIDPPMTAAFLGASYFSAVMLEGEAARRRLWADARIAVPAVFVFTTLTLIVTIANRDRLHLQSSFSGPTRAVTWAWIAIYAVVPILMVFLIVFQLREPGVDPPRGTPLPPWLRVLVGAQGILLVGLGLVMFPAALASRVVHVWPWPLTPLTAGATGAWLIGLGIAAGQAVVENDAYRVRPAADAYIVFGVLNGIALLRFGDDLDWSTPRAWAYLAFLGSAIVAGVAARASGSSRNSSVPAGVNP